MKAKGVVAAGHPRTTEIAELILIEGGNAFDAAVAAFFMACVAEPVLASLGGGGFMVAKTVSRSPFSLDFFVQTPLVKKPDDALDFEEIVIDFGSATQKFHMGHGTVAVPGCVKGIFEIHRQFCRIPMIDLVSPAILAAKQGMAITKEQAAILSLVEPIYVTRQSAKALFVKSENGCVLRENQHYQNPQLAQILEILSLEGEDFFYQGEIAQKIEQSGLSAGGSITRDDLKTYQNHWRKPLESKFNNAQIYLNPPPSAGGMLVNFAMELFASEQPSALSIDSYEYYELIASSIKFTQQARIEALSCSPTKELSKDHLFNSDMLKRYRRHVSFRHKSNHGTTHISVADNKGNFVALTVSNGEGCGEILPQTGIMLNNMLGEDDLNPLGLNQWLPNSRLSSMMCPGIAIKENETVALGSGGSNRIRTAIFQVLVNKIVFNLPLESSVLASRMHYDDELYLETAELEELILNKLRVSYPNMSEFAKRDFYFGGVNAVTFGASNIEAVADPRRGGSAVIVAP